MCLFWNSEGNQSKSEKFAHRGCIQRWCDEKGSTVCEICLEKFEPGYTVTAPSPAIPHLIEVVITIRGSLEAARLNNELQNPAMVAVGSNRHEREQAGELSPASYNSKFCFQSIVLMVIHYHVLTETYSCSHTCRQPSLFNQAFSCNSSPICRFLVAVLSDDTTDNHNQKCKERSAVKRNF
ncbi:hypothetical protein M5K25_021751 [Dendrobium thyrsiflorum]|uniref:RING-CH-type domain-containing protein n=1 Tax=Dendrobium thyrsiflorum TaxID=117978 RepID=A0ABD0UAL8_DENTH